MGTIRPKKDAHTLNGNPVSTLDPTTGDVLTWDGSEWTPAAGGGGGGGVPLNFSQTKGTQVTVTAAEPKPATVISATITTQGNPVQIIVSGDANPSSAGTWGWLNLYRDSTAIGQIVQFESSAGNENVPYSLQVIDEPAAGTWTYSLKVESVTSSTIFGESEGPIITVVELGGVGSATPTGSAGGDLGGTYPNPDVVAIQGYSVSTTAPASGEALAWNGFDWSPTVIPAGATNEVQYNDGTNTLAASSNLTFDSATNDLVVGSVALGNSIRIGPTGYLSNPIIESLNSMNINIVNFDGALGIQAANNDLVLIGGNDGGGESYLQTQNNVRLETKGRLLVQPATDSGTAATFKQSDGTTLLEIDTATPQINAYTRISSLGGGVGLDINPYSIEYVGGAGFLLDSDSGLNLGTTTSTGVYIGSATSAVNISGAFTLPTADGASGEVLTTDGSGNVSWQAGGGSGAIVNTLTTTDNTPSVLATLTPTAASTTVYKATIAAHKQGADEGASYSFVGTFRESAGTVTQIGSTTSIWSVEDESSLDATFNINGANVEVRVTGEATSHPGGITYIDPVSPPVPSGTTWTVGTLGGEDFTDIATALASVSVVNGDRLLLSAETFTVASTITVSKEVTIQGAGLSSTVIQTANTAGDPVTVIDITTNNVTIRDLTVKQRKTSNTTIEVAIAINPATPIGSSGHYLEAVRVEAMEFGVSVKSDGWQINNCELAYVGAANATRRLIGIYRSNGQGIIANTTYDSAEPSISGATRVITINGAAGAPTERFGGYFRITNVTPAVSSTVSQFFNCESFPIGGSSLEFVVDNCTSSESSAFIVFVVDRVNLLSGFSYIALTDNTISGNHGGSPIGTKGLFAVDGSGAGPVSMGTTTFYTDGNVIGNTTFRTGWSTILNTGLGYTAAELALAGFDGVYYSNPSLTISTAVVNAWDWKSSVEVVEAP